MKATSCFDTQQKWPFMDGLEDEPDSPIQ